MLILFFEVLVLPSHLGAGFLRFLPIIFPHQNIVRICLILIRVTCPAPPSLLYLMTVVVFQFSVCGRIYSCSNSFLSCTLLIFFWLSRHFWLSCNSRTHFTLLIYTVLASVLYFSPDNACSITKRLRPDDRGSVSISGMSKLCSLFPLRPDRLWAPGPCTWCKTADV